MKQTEIEAWVLQVADQVSKKQPCEDNRVELKVNWPDDPYKAARQIAAHANASRGENILWIIGIDESKGITGADKTELANWLPQVRSYFSEVYPEVVDINVPVEDKTLVALLFSTESIPYVVKNKVYNQKGGGPVELEVPWREGCSTRSARRSDLIRLLVPISRLPTVNLLGANIVVREPHPDYIISITVHLYVCPYNFQKIAIPCHNCDLKVRIDDIEFGESEQIILEPRIGPLGDKSKLGGSLIECTKTEAIINGPGFLHVNAYSVKLSRSIQVPSSDATLTVKLIPADSDKPIIVTQNLKRTPKTHQSPVVAKWIFGRQTF